MSNENREAIVFKKVSFRDKLVNRIIGKHLSKLDIHVPSDVMERRMESLQGKQTPFDLTDAFVEDLEKTLSYHMQTSRSSFDVDGFPCYVFRPAECGKKKVLYFTGGAFYQEPTGYHIRWIDSFALKAKAELILVDYPKSPTHHYADTYAMAEKVYAQVLKESQAEDIVLMGDSSGGAISLTLPQYFASRGLRKPGSVIVFSAACSIMEKNPEQDAYQKKDPMLIGDSVSIPTRYWREGYREKDGVINPMDLNLAELPRTLMISGDADILYPSGRDFARKAVREGADLKLYVFRGMYHVFEIYYQLNAAGEASDLAADFLNAKA